MTKKKIVWCFWFLFSILSSRQTLNRPKPVANLQTCQKSCHVLWFHSAAPFFPDLQTKKDLICKCYWRLLHAKKMLMHWAKPTFTINLADLPVIPDSLTGVGGRMWPTDSVICQPAFNIQQQKENGCSWTWYHSVSCGTRGLWWGFWKKNVDMIFFYMFFKN